MLHIWGGLYEGISKGRVGREREQKQEREMMKGEGRARQRGNEMR
jgi:hypothetical protein